MYVPLYMCIIYGSLLYNIYYIVRTHPVYARFNVYRNADFHNSSQFVHRYMARTKKKNFQKMSLSRSSWWFIIYNFQTFSHTPGIALLRFVTVYHRFYALVELRTKVFPYRRYKTKIVVIFRAKKELTDTITLFLYI